MTDPYTLGSVFPGIDQAKDALLQHRVAKGLSYRVTKTDSKRYIVECASESAESCEFRLRFTINKYGTVKTTVLTPHTCPPDGHFGWKPAKSAKYLRLKYRGTGESDPKRIRAMEKAHGNEIPYMESWRASKVLRASKASRDPATTDNINSEEEALVEEAPLEEAPQEEAPREEAQLAASEYDNPTDSIMRMHEIDAELDLMHRAGRSRKEIRRRQSKLMAPRLKALEDAHVAYLESKTKRGHRGIPRPEKDGFLDSESLQFFQVPARSRR